MAIYRHKPATIRTFLSAFSTIAAFSLLISSVITILRPTNSHAVTAVASRVALSTNNGVTTATTTSVIGNTGDTFIASCFVNTNSTLTLSGSYTSDGTYAQSGSVSMRTNWSYVTSARNGTSYSWTCTASTSSSMFIVVERVTNLTTATPTLTNSSAATGTPATGNLTASYANTYLLVNAAANNNTALTSWSNSFTSLGGGAIGGPANKKFGFGVAGLQTTAGTYSTNYSTALSVPWLTQFMAFEVRPPTFTASIVDGSGINIASPNFTMSPLSTSFNCQTSTGTLGSSTSKIRVTSEETAAWSLSIAATNGTGATWQNGTGNTYSYNNPSNNGCNNGQLTLNFSPATYLTSCSTGSANTTINSSSTAFSSGVVNAITIMSTNSSAETNCYRELYGIPMSQAVPAERPAGTYNLGLTLTLVAS